ncbi:MAG: hypothetical protein JWO02_385 [Solirubrobacterales bacterium]|nr:hypothetical protein [Solirubrobacterales bacterium]
MGNADAHAKNYAMVLRGRAWRILPGNGFTPAHGYPLLSLADGLTLRALLHGGLLRLRDA